jgi:hypothetical protein
MERGQEGERREKSGGRVVAVMAIISGVMLNFFQYNYTADIIKFATLVSMALSFGTAVLLCRWWEHGPRVKSAVAILALGIIAQGLVFVGNFWFGYPPPPAAIRPYWSLKYPISDDEAAAISFLSATVRPPENIYRWPANDTDTAIANEYSSWGGLPIVWPQYWESALGMSDETINRREALRDLAIQLQNESNRTEAAIGDFVDRLRNEGVVWIVVDRPDYWLIPRLEYLVEDGRATEEQRFGELRVFRLR